MVRIGRFTVLELDYTTITMKSIGIVVIAVWPVLAQDGNPISAERIREHDRFLSSDLLEGRGVGTRGGDLATEYIATQFALAGAKPAGDNGSYFQKVPLVGVEPQRGIAALTATAGGKTVSFQWLDDFVGVSEHAAARRRSSKARPSSSATGSPRPNGSGTISKAWMCAARWWCCSPTSRPRTIPSSSTAARSLITGAGPINTRRPCAAARWPSIIIHTTPTAGYGWDVVRSSWGRQKSYVALRRRPARAGAGRLDHARGRRETPGAGGKERGRTAGRGRVPRLPADSAGDPDPRRLAFPKSSLLDTRNVAAVVPGSDPKLKDEVVIFSAHWDHLGIGEPVNGDAIYNGAIDNATGCAILLELARAWAALPQKPRRSALFLPVTAEEDGLRGSEYYAAHPIFPARQNRHRSELRRALSVGPRQGRRDQRRRADHRLAAGAVRSPGG